ncbi:OmcA/MtrC family decaheme c-type cytochrome [Neiella sp. HB171785]|uniref:OmcA/MtrC family decaheme c-type cytochrome n=1 Tax=Neiella litorisoli TaxID=2771431 RepID=A0A8J6UM96_9GAMM|nr:OmcA/MtrC family decaheme c-type cytochrome [Neiella litorisoli]MBD1390270.1 OmcA/MtrC family decaheme c-type cytochrome [Neiella litorisoli]
MALLRNILIMVGLTMLAGCGGGGSSGSAVQTPTPSNPTPVPTTSFSDAGEIQSAVLSAAVNSGFVEIEFQLVDENGVGIADLAASDLRLTLAKLGPSAQGNLTGHWQSYINQIEQPGVGPGTEPKLQATSENATAGELTNNLDGTYHYRFAQSVEISDQEILAQAKTEGLDLSYLPSVTHRVGMQFANTPTPLNVTFDWNPASGLTEYEGVFGQHISATESCNSCHQQLALHGGGRVEVKYCVTCHNPGSTDANSGNTVNFKTMVHKIHMGRDLPSVQAGGVYQIYGFRDSLHDYSTLGFPGDVLECTQCHAGNATAQTDDVITFSGDNWREYASVQACGSCHDDVDFADHYGGQSNDDNCRSCHQTTGVAGSIEQVHRNLNREASAQFAAVIHEIRDTAPGQFPVVRFSIVDPTNNNHAYDILNDSVWTQPNGASRLYVDIGWDTQDYSNTGNQGNNANAVEINALTQAVAVGDGSFEVTSSVAIPDGTLEPNIAAKGSGAVNIEGHPASDVGNGVVERVAMTNEVAYFTIDDASALARRQVADLDSCLTCHGQLSFHGANRTDNLETCAICHNPRNTDKRVREVALNPPSDGKDEESLDFKTMIHGIHAADMREQPLQLVGFGGFNTYVFDSDHVHYPRDLADCQGCHIEGTYGLPSTQVLATTVSTGVSIADPTDDIVTSSNAAVCSSCHDSSSAKLHMEQNGASFATSQAEIDAGVVLEQCSVCHGSGRVYDVEVVHRR